MVFSRKKKNCSPPVEDINRKFQEGRINLLGVLGTHKCLEDRLKFEEKNTNFQGLITKKWKVPGGVMIKSSNGNPGGQLQKKLVCL